MGNNKTKRWPFIVSGCLLTTYALIRLVKNISLWFSVPESFSFINLVLAFFHLTILVLGITMFRQKKNLFTIMLLGIMLLIHCFWFGRLLFYIFKWPLAHSFVSFISHFFPLISISTLILITILSFSRINALLVRTLWFIPAAIEFICMFVSLIFNILLNHVTATYYIQTVSMQILYCVAIFFLGRALTTPFLKSH